MAAGSGGCALGGAARNSSRLSALTPQWRPAAVARSATSKRPARGSLAKLGRGCSFIQTKGGRSAAADMVGARPDTGTRSAAAERRTARAPRAQAPHVRRVSEGGGVCALHFRAQMKLFGGVTGLQSVAAWLGASAIAYVWFTLPTRATTLSPSDLANANEKRKASLDAKGLK